MPKSVYLIGDSIRMSYQDPLRDLLAPLATVAFPADNAGHTVNILVHLHLWVLNPRPFPAVVHINSGLHDLKTLYFGSRDSIIPLDHYRKNVRTILSTILSRTTAKPIWATITPVQDALHHTAHAQWNDFDRFNDDVLRYNDAARDVCRELRVPINDLYAIASTADLPRIQTPDGVHFNPEGAAILARATAQVITPLLA